MITEELKKLYITHTGHEPEAIDELPSSGSNRRYFRLKGTPTLIGVSGESVEENRAFLYMAEHFRGKGLPVPEVFIRSEDNIYYLQEDLGDTLLFNAIEKGRKTRVFDEEEKQLLRKTMRLLPAVQFAGADGMDFSYCYPQAEFNSRSILLDLNYFKYCFLKATGMDFQEDRLKVDKPGFAILNHHVAALEVAIHESSGTAAEKHVCHFLEIIFQADVKGLSTTTWPHSCGKPRPIIPTACAKNF